MCHHSGQNFLVDPLGIVPHILSTVMARIVVDITVQTRLDHIQFVKYPMTCCVQSLKS